MMYMQSNLLLQLTNLKNQLRVENQMAPSSDNAYALMGIEEECNGNLQLANEYYRKSSHYIAIGRYLSLNNLQALAHVPQIQVTAQNQAQVYIQLPPMPATTSPAYHLAPIASETPEQSTPVQANPKKAILPKISAKTCAKKLPNELMDVLYKLKSINYHFASNDKMKIASELGWTFKELDSIFQKCKRRGLVERWPHLTNYGHEVLHEHGKLKEKLAKQSASKSEVAKALLNMRDLVRERARMGNVAQNTEQAPEAEPAAEERMSIKFLTS